MTDFVRRTDGNVVAPGEGVSGVGLSHEEIDAILDDPTTSPEEKMARMEELRERVVHRDDEAYAPLSTRIMDALSMLAQGGHAYADTPLNDETKR